VSAAVGDATKFPIMRLERIGNMSGVAKMLILTSAQVVNLIVRDFQCGSCIFVIDTSVRKSHYFALLFCFLKNVLFVEAALS
jgi:hypothetical protein